MRIVQVCPRYSPYLGGVEKHVQQISERFQARGHQLQVVSTDPSGKLERDAEVNGVPVTRLPVFAPDQTIFFSRALHRELKTVHADLVHAHDYQAWPMLAAALSQSSNRVPLVVTLHLGFSKLGQWLYAFYNPVFGRYIFNRARRIIIVSPATFSTVPLLTSYKRIVEYIPNGIELDGVDAALRAHRPAKDAGRLDLLSVSRLERKKGLHLVVEALSRLDARNYRYRIVGEGPFRGELERRVKLARLPNVEFLGRVDGATLARLYASSHIFVQPSDYESHSISLIEAMAYGLVPVVTQVGGNVHVIDDQRNGLLLRHPVRIDELTDRLARLRENRNMRAAVSLNARAAVRACYSLDETCANLERVYDECYR
jgi:glycosyltransferase involved in cell wall biosynthesis